MRTLKEADWVEEGEKKFGERKRDWKFVCPKCNTVQTGQDFLDEGVDKDEVIDVLGFSCIGRYVEKKGCDWTLGGLFKIHVLEVEREDGKKTPVFEFAKVDQ